MTPKKNQVSQEYDLLLLLEQLESLREDMEDLKVTNLAEVEQRIANLHEELDERENK